MKSLQNIFTFHKSSMKTLETSFKLNTEISKEIHKPKISKYYKVHSRHSARFWETKMKRSSLLAETYSQPKILPAAKTLAMGQK